MRRPRRKKYQGTKGTNGSMRECEVTRSRTVEIRKCAKERVDYNVNERQDRFCVKE